MNEVVCNGDCMDCKRYFNCESDIKLDEETCNFWFNERESDSEE